jgi:hypothetical protein
MGRFTFARASGGLAGRLSGPAPIETGLSFSGNPIRLLSTVIDFFQRPEPPR